MITGSRQPDPPLLPVEAVVCRAADDGGLVGAADVGVGCLRTDFTGVTSSPTGLTFPSALKPQFSSLIAWSWVSTGYRSACISVTSNVVLPCFTAQTNSCRAA